MLCAADDAPYYRAAVFEFPPVFRNPALPVTTAQADAVVETVRYPPRVLRARPEGRTMPHHATLITEPCRLRGGSGECECSWCPNHRVSGRWAVRCVLLLRPLVGSPVRLS